MLLLYEKYMQMYTSHIIFKKEGGHNGLIKEVLAP